MAGETNSSQNEPDPLVAIHFPPGRPIFKDGVRQGLVARTRAKIAEGSHDTGGKKLDIALQGLHEDLAKLDGPTTGRR